MENRNLHMHLAIWAVALAFLTRFVS